MLLIRYSMVSLCLILSTRTMAFHPPDEITWAYTNSPPVYITEGAHSGSGFGQKLTNQIISRLPYYNHAFMEATFPRIMNELKAGKRICYATLHKQQERSKYIVFSRAALISPKTWFLASKDKIEPFIQDNKVSITKILNERELVVAKLLGRSYGPLLDEAFDNHERLNLLVLDSQQRLIELVARGRIDGTFVHSGELEFFKATYKSSAGLALYEIEGGTPYLPGYIGCAKTKWGEHVIHHINEILEQLAGTATYKSAITSWWGAESDSTDFDHAMDTLINESR